MKKIALLTLLAALILAIGSIAVVQAEILPPYGEGQIGLSAEILCDSLTLRREPNSSSKAVRTLHYGDILIVMKQEGKWAYCTIGDSEDSPQGWVNADYIAIDPARYRTEEKTPVYAWDDTSAPKVALLDKGVTLPILKSEGRWLVVSLRGASGWILR